MVRNAIPSEPVFDGQRYYGVIKSYNERRGFGFVACEETARIWGRDVYLSKEEVNQLAKEPIVSGGVSPSQSAEDGQPSLKEGDFVSFQVQKSTEGYPQAVSARRLRRLRGSVLQGTLPRDGGEGKIVVKGDGKEGAEATAAPDAELQCLMGAEVRVRQTDCGQLRLVPGDEVIFCCQASDDGAADGLGLEAQLVELLWTPRTNGSGSGSILGCFQLELPRTPEPVPEGEELKPTGAPVLLDGHGLVDRVLLAGLPNDLEAPELMRLFSKLGASDCVVTCPDCDPAHISRFATISFSGPADVARMLARAAHTINAQGCTQLARLLPHRDEVVALPALPVPALTVSDGGALLVQWQQVGLAAGYLVELRPRGADAPWASVGVASGKLEDADNLPPGLLGPQCAACRVNCISGETPYEARVTYYTSWGCRSQASAASAPCSLAGGSNVAMPQAPPSAPSASAVQPSGPEHSPAPLLPASMIGGPETEARTSSFLGTDPSAGMPFTFPAEHGPLLSVPGTSQLPPNIAAAAAIAANGPGWRTPFGNILPPPAAPELVPYEEAGGRSVCIQWPTVVHATAYTVELLEEGASAAERFTRAVPEILPEALVELRVGNLNPGAYAACVRCVAPCGCESAPSPWSFLPPFWMPPPPVSLGLGPWPPQVPGMQPLEPSTALPGAASGGQSLLSTNPSAQPNVPPPPPSAPPTWPAASLGITSPAPGAAEDEALVLD